MNKFPQFSGAVPIDDRGILDALRGSDIVKKATAERDTHVVAFRKTVAGKLAKIEAEAEVKFPKMRTELDVAVKVSREAEIVWRQKADNAYALQAALSAEHGRHCNELASLESQLAETASPEISIFIYDMRLAWDECFSKFEVHHDVEKENIITRSRERSTRTNVVTLKARQTAIRDAIASAEAMRLEPDQSTVSVRLQELRQNLPSIASV
jgi:hypothetical protein